MMRPIFSAISIMTFAGLIISCGPKPPATDVSKDTRCLPDNLVVDSTGSNYALLAWNPGCPGVRILRGFNIYTSPTPLISKYPGTELPPAVKPVNARVYPGDTLGDPLRETFALEDIENAVAHYVHVRAVYSDGALSPPTDEIRLVTFAQGSFALRESYTGGNDGFSIVAGEYCRTDDLINDLYFYHKDGQDFLCSPIRIGDVYRNTKIFSAGPETPETWASMNRDDRFEERVSVEPNGVYILILAEGYPAKLVVRSIERIGDSRTITFDYICKPPVVEASPIK